MQRNILIATILTAHGLRGWVKLHWHGEDPLRAIEYKTLYDKSGRMFEIEEQRMQGKALAVKFKDINDRTTAEKLRGTELFIDRGALPPIAENEFYHADLIGLTAKTPNGKYLGSVKSIQNYGASDILEIEKLSGETELFTFTDDVVQEIDYEKEVIIIVQPIVVE